MSTNIIYNFIKDHRYIWLWLNLVQDSDFNFIRGMRWNAYTSQQIYVASHDALGIPAVELRLQCLLKNRFLVSFTLNWNQDIVSLHYMVLKTPWKLLWNYDITYSDQSLWLLRFCVRVKIPWQCHMSCTLCFCFPVTIRQCSWNLVTSFVIKCIRSHLGTLAEF